MPAIASLNQKTNGGSVPDSKGPDSWSFLQPVGHCQHEGHDAAVVASPTWS